MFDLKLQGDESAVPVPLPGRVLMFVNDAGQLMGRMPDGSVVGLGGAGPQGEPGAEGPQGEPGAEGPQGVPGVNASAFCSFSAVAKVTNTGAYVSKLVEAVGGDASEPWRLSFRVFGVQTNGTAASTGRFFLYRGEALKASVSMGWGTVARVDKSWVATFEVSGDGGNVCAYGSVIADGLAASGPVFFSESGSPDSNLWSVRVSFSSPVSGCSITSRGGHVTGARGVGGAL